MNIEEFKNLPKKSEWDQKNISNIFLSLTNDNHVLKEFRDYVEQHVYGFGEREFISMWKMIVESIDSDINFLEIGVYKGQILALMRMLGKNINVTGLTPLDSTDGHPDDDYAKAITDLHNHYNLKHPNIIHGLSTDTNCIKEAAEKGLYDIVYIDGGHEYDIVKSDLSNFPKLVKPGGYLVIDDCANFIDGCYWGRFWGIEPVSKAVDEFLPPKTKHSDFEYIGNVIHNRIFKHV